MKPFATYRLFTTWKKKQTFANILTCLATSKTNFFRQSICNMQRFKYQPTHRASTMQWRSLHSISLKPHYKNTQFHWTFTKNSYHRNHLFDCYHETMGYHWKHLVVVSYSFFYYSIDLHEREKCLLNNISTINFVLLYSVEWVMMIF